MPSGIAVVFFIFDNEKAQNKSHLNTFQSSYLNKDFDDSYRYLEPENIYSDISLAFVTRQPTKLFLVLMAGIL